ncbi:MAG: class I SAM-dependent methyltransferase, partial [Proteobacteria bacterium]|nr:class I SAM-dependent methyltransferase [Pseudomonadota bacterium]
MSWLPGVHVAPNIQSDPALYEVENRALDRDGHITAAMRHIAPWNDRVVLDLGSGTGFWASVFEPDARHVVCVEPHAPSRLMAAARIAREGWTTVDSLVGSAAWIPLRDGSVDLVHARFAYFFGPGCEPGLAEVERVLAPGGTCIVIDN